MGLFDSNANTTTTDLSDKSQKSAGQDVYNVGSVSGKKNTQNVNLSRSWEDNDNSVSNSNNVDNRIEDSNNTDNSVSYDDSFNTINEYDYSQEFELEQDIDNSQEFEESFNTTTNVDSSTHLTGEYAGNSGTINITDGGAFDAMKDAVKNALSFGEKSVNEMSSVSNNALNTALNVADDAARLAEAIVDENGRMLVDISKNNTELFQSSVQSNREIYGDSMTALSDVYANAVNANENVTDTLSESLTAASEETQQFYADVMQQQAQQATAQLETTQQLAETVSTGGQTVVAETSARIIKYVSIAAGLVGLAVVGSKVF